MKKQTTELKDKSIKELEKGELTLRQEIAKSEQELKVSPPKDTNLIWKKKKRLAVLLTVLSEKKEVEKFKKVEK